MTNIKISKEVFERTMKRLEAAFRQDIPEPSLKLYFEKLKSAPDQDFIAGAEHIIDHDNFFPSIARLREVILPVNKPLEYTGNIEDLFK